MQAYSHTFGTYRRDIVDQLSKYLSDKNGLPQSIFIYGASGTGKTQTISSLLRQTIDHPIIVNCSECFTSKNLLETIVNGVFKHEPSLENKYSSYATCNNAREFLDALEECDPYDNYVIMIDGAEMLMKMEDNILPIFLRLKELSNLNVCCVLVSTLHINSMISKDTFEDTIVIYWPQYIKKEVLKIMLDKFDDYKTFVKNNLLLTKGINYDISNLEAIIESMDVNFFENYLHLFLNVTLRSCRNIRDLLSTSRACFQKYCEPVLDGSVDIADVQKLYRNVSEILKNSMIKTYDSIEESSQITSSLNTTTMKQLELPISKSSQTTSSLNAMTMKQLELPFYAKYLLIAAYLASHNDAKSDKRLFMKHHGKQRKRLQDIRSKAVVNEKLSTQLGPKSFNLDRLFAIFYAIIDEKIPLNCNLMSQIPSLVRLKLLTYVLGENNVMDGNARLQCTVGLTFILQIGKSVGFNVAQHLCDFM